MATPSGYPIIISVPPQIVGNTVNYTVSIGSLTIFNGTYVQAISRTEVINLQNIIGAYIGDNYSEIFNSSGNMPTTGNKYMNVNVSYTVRNATTSTNITSGSISVVYDYNTDYATNVNINEGKNDFIDLTITAGQRMTFTGINTGGNYSVSGGAGSGSTAASNMGLIILTAPNLVVGSAVVVTDNYGKQMPFEVIRTCDAPFIIYYVNKKGGLDWLHLKRNPVERFVKQAYEITKFNYAGSTNFSDQFFNQSEVKEYDLTTRMLSKEAGRKMDNLIFTPHAWLYNSETDAYVSVIPVTDSFEVKTYPRTNDLTYTFTVRESNKYIRQ